MNQETVLPEQAAMIRNHVMFLIQLHKELQT